MLLSRERAKGDIRPMKTSMHEPARDIPVIGNFDLCVIGGSCTGVFAAVRAARLGLSVAIVERMGSFGGVATISNVNLWHSDLDEVYERQIFAGLTLEMIDRLKKRGNVVERERCPHCAWAFNPAEMQVELDRIVLEHGIEPFLHTAFAAPLVEGENLAGIAVENKSGRAAIRARFFIDASGDGDLCQRLGLETRPVAARQPSTTCALVDGWETLGDTDWQSIIREHGNEEGLPDGFVWGATVPGTGLFMLAGPRVFEDCSTGNGFAAAEIEGRRQAEAMVRLLGKYVPDSRLGLGSFPARIGIRQSRHVRCLYRLTGEDVLSGRLFPDAIANGSYRVDIHHNSRPGVTLRYLDGREVYARPGYPEQISRWREETATNPTFYQIPYRSLVPEGPYGNLLAAGRFIDADEQAHGAIRVMVNMNQTGEAAGTAAFLALKNGIPAREVEPSALRANLAEGGSIVI